MLARVHDCSNLTVSSIPHLEKLSFPIDSVEAGISIVQMPVFLNTPSSTFCNLIHCENVTFSSEKIVAEHF